MCLHGGQLVQNHAVSGGGGLNLFELAELVHGRGYDELAAAPVRDAVSLAVFIELLAARDTEPCLQRATGIVDSGMNHFAVTGTGDGAERIGRFEHHDVPPAHGQRPGDREPDDTRASDDHFHIIHGRDYRLGLIATLRAPMLISEISIHRPIFATVLSLMLIVVGLIGLTRLWQGIRELPNIEALIVSVETRYRGAAPEIIETKVTQPIEDRIAGIEHIDKLQILELRRALADFDRVRPGPGYRRSRQRRSRSRRPGAEPVA